VIIRYRAQALADIDEIYSYLLARSPQGAQNVLRAVYAAIHLLAEQPYSSPMTDMPGVRVKALTRYRFRVFYSVVGERVEIIHIRHTSRKPWP